VPATYIQKLSTNHTVEYSGMLTSCLCFIHFVLEAASIFKILSKHLSLLAFPSRYISGKFVNIHSVCRINLCTTIVWGCIRFYSKQRKHDYFFSHIIREAKNLLIYDDESTPREFLMRAYNSPPPPDGRWKCIEEYKTVCVCVHKSYSNGRLKTYKCIVNFIKHPENWVTL